MERFFEILCDGRPPLRGHRRQVHRRRHHGAVRRADRPRGPRPARLLRGAAPRAGAGRLRGASCAASRGSASRCAWASTPARWWSARSARTWAWTTPRSATPWAWPSAWSSSPSPARPTSPSTPRRSWRATSSSRTWASSRSRARAGRLRVHELTGVGAARGRLDVSRARGFSRFVGRDDELRVLEDALEQARRRTAAGDRDRRRGRASARAACATCSRGAAGRGASPSTTPPGRRTPSRSRCCRCSRSCAPTSTSPTWTPTRPRASGSPASSCCSTRASARTFRCSSTSSPCPIPSDPSPRMDPEARQRRLLDAHQAPGPRPERPRAGRHAVRGPALARLRQRGVRRQPRRGRSRGRAASRILNFRPEYQRAVDVEVLLPPDRARAARPGGDRAAARGPARLRSVAGRAGRTSSASAPRATRSSSRRSCYSLVEAGNLEGERGAYRLVRPVDEAAVPASVQAVLSARIDRLAEREKSRAAGGRGDRQGVLRIRSWRRSTGLEPDVPRGRASPARGGRVRLRAGALPGGDLRVPASRSRRRSPTARSWASAARRCTRQSARADRGRAARSGSTSGPRCWPSTGRARASRSRRRAGTRAPAMWTGTNDPTASLEPLAQGARADRRPARLPGDGRSSALTARILLSATAGGWASPSEEAEALFTEAERMASQAKDALVAGDPARQLRHHQVHARGGSSSEAAALSRQAIALAEESGDPALYMTVAASSYVLLPDRRVRARGWRSATAPSSWRPAIPRSAPGSALECPLAQLPHAEGRDPVRPRAGSTREAS